MKTKRVSSLVLLLTVLSFVLSACGLMATEPPTSTPQPTATITLTPTNTPFPTKTPRPTRTPNLAATQQIERYQAEIENYANLGYIMSAEGRHIAYDDFTMEWAQLRWYRWWQYDDLASDFVMSAHFKWSSAYRNADVSGCGLVFAIQDNGDHFAVFLDRTLIRFLNNDQSGYTRRMGVTRGTGRVNFNNPADQPIEADFTLIVNNAYAYVLVDDEVVGEYTLPQSRVLRGKLGLSVLSGTNKDYGTRCEMTNIHVFFPEN